MIYKTVPLRGTPFITNRKRLSQGSTNRLLNVRVRSILNRLLIDDDVNEQFVYVDRRAGEVPVIPEDDKAILLQVLSAPTQEELSDLALIDTVFIWRSEPKVNRVVPESPPQCLYELRSDHKWSVKGWGALTSERFSRSMANVSQNPFYCTQPVPIPANYVIDAHYGVKEYFKLNESETWGVEKSYVDNAVSVLTALQDYPFPSPIPIMPTIWYWMTQDDLVRLVHTELPLTPYAARIIITLLTLQKYDAVSTKIMDELEEKESRSRWKSVVKKLGLAATFAVIGAGILSALTPAVGAARAEQLVQGVKSVSGYALSQSEKRKAAQDLASTAKLFEESDAGYAAELYETASVIDTVATEEIRNGPLSEEMLEALEDLGLNPPLRPEDVGGPFYPSLDSLTSLSTETLLIGGGVIVAAGIVLYALLK